MRIKIALRHPLKHSIILPTGYFHLVQSMIYHNLDENFADFLHNTAYGFDKHIFKLFTFSQILEKAKLKQGRANKFFLFPSTIHLIISSPVDDTLLAFVKILSKKRRVRLGKEYLDVSGIEVLFPPVFKEKHIIQTLSPITAHSTYTDDGRHTYFYSPNEQEFPQFLGENLVKKFTIANNAEIIPDKFFFSILPIKIKSSGLYYKKFFIKGWEGIFELQTNTILMETAYDAGLGARNSAGFGLFEIVD